MKAKAKPTLEAIAARIDEHLKKMEKTRRFYKPNAHRIGTQVMVAYIDYGGGKSYASSLSRKEAEKYLAWLDAGNTGEHWKVI